MRWFFYCIRHYAKFDGRASRREFWAFQLFSFITGTLITAIGKSTPIIGVFALWAFSIVITLPSVAVATRRLHDIGRSASILRRMMILGVTEIAYWFGVFLSHGRDQLALWAAYSVSAIALVFWLGLTILYLLPGQDGPNQFGHSAPEKPH